MYDTYMMTHGTRTFLRMFYCYLHGIMFQLCLMKIFYVSMFFTVAHILAYNQVIMYSKYNIIAQEKTCMYTQIILIGTYFGQ